MNKILITTLNLGAILLFSGCGVQNVSPEVQNFTPESRKTLIPETCHTFFDGCNNCMKMDNGEAACTRMFCEKYDMPKCTDKEQSEEPIEVANPASKYCITQGGISQIKKNADGSEYGVCVVDGEEIDEWEYFQLSTKQFIGRPLTEVQKEIEANGTSIRITIENGEAKAITTDYRLDRLNVEVMSGIIVNAYFG